MKKVLSLCLLMFVGVCLFAENATNNSSSPKQKTTGASIGVRFSILGLEPTASIIYKKTEIEASCPIISNTVFSESYPASSHSKEVIGYMPGVSFGYLSRAFERGWQNGVGVLWYMITPAYLESLSYDTSSSSGVQITGPDVHAFGLYYKSGLRFNSGVNIYFRIMFPLALWCPQTNETYTIINREMSLLASLVCIITPSIGVRYSF